MDGAEVGALEEGVEEGLLSCRVVKSIRIGSNITTTPVAARRRYRVRVENDMGDLGILVDVNIPPDLSERGNED